MILALTMAGSRIRVTGQIGKKKDPPTMSEEIKFVAKLSRVTEVSLLGTADLDYWHDRLRPYGLSLVPLDGAAQILVIAAKARFMGIPFCEVSFSVIVSPSQKRHALQDAVCLFRAFNSNRVFAFCERTLFETPYYPAKCEISLDPLNIKVSSHKEVLFSAQMGSVGHREGVHSESDGWHGTITFIPPKSLPGAPCKYFVGRLEGATTTYSYEQSNDILILSKESGISIFSQLEESEFHGKQWIVRTSANHAKSKTYSVTNTT